MQDWNARYENSDTPWDRGEASPALAPWISKTAVGRVIVPGCGAGHEVVELASAGFEVTAIDLAPAALEKLAKKLAEKNLAADLVEANVLTWRPLTPVDYVFEQTCFCALDPEHWRNYVAQLQSWIRADGVLKASFMQTGKEGGPPYHCPVEAMRDYFLNKDWRWPDKAPMRIEHPRGDIFELSVELRRRS